MLYEVITEGGLTAEGAVRIVALRRAEVLPRVAIGGIEPEGALPAGDRRPASEQPSATSKATFSQLDHST